MKFASLALAEAEGAILAHTLRLPDGRVLKKGRRLSDADVAALAAAGRREVIGAKLEAGDVHEDAAAVALARAVAGPGLRAAEPSTGRCNLHAETAGLLLVDRERIDRINGTDESLTLATLAPFAVVAAGTLAVTVKVIPFAVPAAALDACIERARGEGPALRVAPFRRFDAGLIVTQAPGLAPEAVERAAASQRARMRRLGGRVLQEIRCPHEEGAVAEAIESLFATGCAPILLLGASAIVDRRDVIPAAVERAGGIVEHLGMPVDPGNLLLLARHGATPVIGLPGCARSLAPSGADQVLERLAAGLAVTGRDLTRLGTGGLLKEVAGRGQPREPTVPRVAGAPRVGAVVLAAGRSRRMGADNKLLADVDGVPLIARVVDAVLASRARPVAVVTGHEAARVRAALAGREIIFAHNPDHAEGMSTSLRVGIAALGEPCDGALVCLGDMPWVTSAHLDALIAAFDPASDRPICVPFYQRKRGNPVLWPRRYFDEIGRLSGDTGARALLDAHADEVRAVRVADEGVTLDVDTPDALAALRTIG